MNDVSKSQKTWSCVVFCLRFFWVLSRTGSGQLQAFRSGKTCECCTVQLRTWHGQTFLLLHRGKYMQSEVFRTFIYLQNVNK